MTWTVLYCLKFYKYNYTQTCTRTCDELDCYIMQCDSNGWLCWHIAYPELRRQGQDPYDCEDSWVYKVNIVNSMSVRAT